MNSFLSPIIAISLLLISTNSWSNDDNGFNHPGLFHSQNDLDRMREAVEAKEEPITTIQQVRELVDPTSNIVNLTPIIDERNRLELLNELVNSLFYAMSM